MEEWIEGGKDGDKRKGGGEKIIGLVEGGKEKCGGWGSMGELKEYVVKG